MITEPSICCSQSWGLIALPTSWAATTFNTLTIPVSISTSTSAAWVANIQKMLLMAFTPCQAESREDSAGE